jgi:ribosomal protein L29
LELKEAYRKELEEEVEELRKELRRERIRYEAELFEKEEIIGSLCGELN